MKILSPVGNFDSLKMAVFNGADEVYFGINDFNARNNIDGFSLNEIEQVVDFSHAFNVKALLAINILFSDDELQSALDIVVDAFNLGVDAFIVQDLGLASLIAKHYPQIELHASTQMGLHNLEGVKFAESFGFKRVVLARETPMKEIKRIKENSNVEIEYFVQGALCVSFSGNCYLSGRLFGASGNRGKCKQLCRLPYTFEKNGNPLKKGYLLSAKDFNMINRLDDLKNAGVDVLKIEGRARRPAYVGMVTKEYFNALHKNKVNKENIGLAFNRNFTEGYFNGNGQIISNIQNHIGLEIGTVEKVTVGKNFNEVIITSNRELYPKSTFKFFAKNTEQATLTAYDLKPVAKGKYKLTTTQKVAIGNTVRLILDSKKENEILQTQKKREIQISINASKNLPIKAKIDLGFKIIEVVGPVCEIANNQPLTEETFISNFSKHELFFGKLTFKKLDKIFLTKQKLNDFRRMVFDDVYKELTLRRKHSTQKQKIEIPKTLNSFDNFQIVEKPNEPLKALNIIYSPSFYDLHDIQSFKSLCEKQNKSFFLDLPNFALEEDIKVLKNIIANCNLSVIANNYYALSLTDNFIVGAGLNVYNHQSASIFDKPVITTESNISARINFPYMTLRHCPFKNHLGASCAKCPYKEDFQYRMENGTILKLKRKKMSSCTFYLTD